MLRQVSGVAMLALAACATATSSILAAPVVQLKPAPEVTKDSLLAIEAICGADIAGAPASPQLKLAAGMGTGGFTVDSTNKDAQQWFDYGLALSHAFYHQDAIAAMKRSTYADPSCSLCAWGLAWTMGPTLNYGIDDKHRNEALVVAERAKSLARLGDTKAERLADALIARYQNEGTEPAFGAAMAKIAGDYPKELELSVLAAHSLLIPVRDDNNVGLKPALALLDNVLKQRPDDTGAIHYYIHATEFDGRAEDAIPYADKLGRLAPAASHLVHMPAHTFFHAGRYEDAAMVNAKAIEADADWLKAGGDPYAPADPEAVPMYYIHNLAFGLAGALMSGDGELALKYYDVSQKKVWKDDAPPPGRVFVALGRYAPDRALQIPEQTGKDAKHFIYRHYARGEAFLTKGDVAAARIEVKAIGAVKGADGAPEQTIARKVLEGRIAMAEGRPENAAKSFESAAKLQEARLSGYMDPPSWWYPVRRSVAAAYLKARDYKRAEAEAEKSLKAWKHDPLALWVLGNAQLGAGHLGQGEATMSEARDLWRGDWDSITADAI